MEKVFGDINQVGQSNLCTYFPKETTQALMVIDRARSKIMW